MLIIFHLLQLFVWNLMNKRKHTTATETPQTESNESQGISCNFQQDEEVQLKFDPPVYRQRYGKVYEILLNDKWRKDVKKIVDFGCAEFGLFIFLKNLTSIQEMLFIDIDEALLTENLFRLQPLMFEHLIRRNSPLELNVYLGSVSLPDQVLTGCDAVIAIELIEHLYPDTLDAFPYNIFAFIQPKLVILSTPNADFNIVFKKMGKFRHYDHKFEWTREQFQDWASNCVNRFPNYSVEFSGCGDPPLDSPNIGYCSQVALFTRTYKNCDLSEKNLTSFGVCTYMSRTPSEFTDFNDFSFKHLRKIEYPYDTDERTEEERILDDIKYRMCMFGSVNSRFYNVDKDRCEIPLEDIMYNLHVDINELKRILQNSGYTVEECRIAATDEWKLCIIHVPEDTMDNSEISECESEAVDENVNGEELSDWDNDVCAPPKVDEEKKADPLVDSGYQKSSIVDDSPQSPSAEEMDSFDESPKNVKKFLDTNTVNELQNVPNKPFKLRKKSVKDALPGPSNVARREIGPKKASTPSDSEEEGYWEDVRSIANCLLENTLNKIDVNAEEPMELIEQNVEDEQDAPLVENGDLANNNRDLEGNNYVADDVEVDVVEDQVNDNLEVDEGVVLVEENNNEDNHIEGEIVEEAGLIEQPAEVVALASREALFDPNSEQDLLIDEDFNEEDCVVIGVRMEIADNSDGQTFPSWLLQILGSSETEGHDEPHFYCQGDGLGVHPSIVVDDDDDSSNSNTSSQHTDVEQDQQDVTESEFSLPEDSHRSEEMSNGQVDSRVQTEEFYDALANPEE